MTPTTPEMLDLMSQLKATIKDWYSIAPQYRTKPKLIEMLADEVTRWTPNAVAPKPLSHRVSRRR